MSSPTVCYLATLDAEFYTYDLNNTTIVDNVGVLFHKVKTTFKKSSLTGIISVFNNDLQKEYMLAVVNGYAINMHIIDDT